MTKSVGLKHGGLIEIDPAPGPLRLIWLRPYSVASVGVTGKCVLARAARNERLWMYCAESSFAVGRTTANVVMAPQEAASREHPERSERENVEHDTNESSGCSMFSHRCLCRPPVPKHLRFGHTKMFNHGLSTVVMPSVFRQQTGSQSTESCTTNSRIHKFLTCLRLEDDSRRGAFLRPNLFDTLQRIRGHIDHKIGGRSCADQLDDRASNLIRRDI